MQCPHCRLMIHPDPLDIPIGEDKDGGWLLRRIICPACLKFILLVVNGSPVYTPDSSKFVGLYNERRRFLVWPKTHTRPACPAQVPEEIPTDDEEACQVLADTPKASAALRRRCLQAVLRDAGGVSHSWTDNCREVVHGTREYSNGRQEASAEKGARVVGQTQGQGVHALVPGVGGSTSSQENFDSRPTGSRHGGTNS
jgi:hypothetical protein